MRRLILTAMVAVACLAGFGLVGKAQTQAPANHPDFSGKWAVDIQASAPGMVLDGERLLQPFLTNPATLQPSFANEFVARQDSTTLRVQRETHSQGKTTSLSVVYYKLDGSESKNVEGEMTRTASTAQWQNSTLTIVTRLVDRGTLPQSGKLVRIMSLDVSGRLLIETTLDAAPAYLTVYRRAS